LEPVILHGDTKVHEILEYFMGKNTPNRRDFIMENLKVEEDVVEDAEALVASRAQEFAAEAEGTEDSEAAPARAKARK